MSVVVVVHSGLLVGLYLESTIALTQAIMTIATAMSALTTIPNSISQKKLDQITYHCRRTKIVILPVMI